MGRPRQRRAATATWSRSLLGDDTVPDQRSIEIPETGDQEICRPRVPDFLGSYRIVGVLGEGGIARVYLGEHEVIGKRVAIKTLLPHLTRNAAAHQVFVREARIACAVHHPNLVDIYDYNIDGYGNPYFVMELVMGETLASRIERAPLALSECFDISIRLTGAISAVHSAGYLHRDIKSENVLLASDGGRRIIPKLIDFGIARALGVRDEDEGMVGTPRTMAPEQIAQDDVDERTDVWSLGVLLYEMLTGHLPFPAGRSIRDDLVAIVTEPPLPLGLGYPPDVRRIVSSCLRKDPDQRPASASILLDQLRAARRDYQARTEVIERALAADELDDVQRLPLH